MFFNSFFSKNLEAENEPGLKIFNTFDKKNVVG